MFSHIGSLIVNFTLYSLITSPHHFCPKNRVLVERINSKDHKGHNFYKNTYDNVCMGYKKRRENFTGFKFKQRTVMQCLTKCLKAVKKQSTCFPPNGKQVLCFYTGIWWFIGFNTGIWWFIGFYTGIWWFTGFNRPTAQLPGWKTIIIDNGQPWSLLGFRVSGQTPPGHKPPDKNPLDKKPPCQKPPGQKPPRENL